MRYVLCRRYAVRRRYSQVQITARSGAVASWRLQIAGESPRAIFHYSGLPWISQRDAMRSRSRPPIHRESGEGRGRGLSRRAARACRSSLTRSRRVGVVVEPLDVDVTSLTLYSRGRRRLQGKENVGIVLCCTRADHRRIVNYARMSHCPVERHAYFYTLPSLKRPCHELVLRDTTFTWRLSYEVRPANVYVLRISSCLFYLDMV